MSGRFVRASSYRHVFGTASKKPECFQDLRPAMASTSNGIYASDKYWALPLQGGGGPVAVHALDKPGRLGNAVHKISVHKGKVLACAFNPFNGGLLATASDDGYAKVTAFDTKTGLTANITDATVTLEGHMKKVNDINFHPTAANVLATLSSDNHVKLWDIEAQAEFADFSTAGNGFMTDWNTDGSLMAVTAKAASGPNELIIVDPRTGAAAATSNPHTGTKQMSCRWVDSFNQIATVGFSKHSQRQFYLWDARNLGADPVHKLDIDQGAGVFCTHFDEDNNILYMGGKGDSGIKYFEITAEGAFFLSEFGSTSPQKGLGFTPKRGLNIKKCEIARGLRLMRDYIEPVSFCVPRKSEMFQEDLYPNTYAGVSAQTADAYKAGGNAAPVKMSMNPKERGEEVEVAAFVAKKSPAQLQKELDAALARIAELEAQLKA